MTQSRKLIFGIHAVFSALRNNPARVQELRVDRGRRDGRLRELRAHALTLDIRLREVDTEILNRQAPGQRHQGVIALCQASAPLHETALAALLKGSAQALLLALDGITDPHNLGAILRTAEAAGVQAIIAPKNRAAGINATVRKVACGAAERLPFLQVTNLVRTLHGLKEQGLWLIGTNEASAQSLYDVDLTRPVALVMGAEGTGLRRLTRELCDFVVQIPMASAAQSLNVSVAAGVCLFEIRRQRRARSLV